MLLALPQASRRSMLEYLSTLLSSFSSIKQDLWLTLGLALVCAQHDTHTIVDSDRSYQIAHAWFKRYEPTDAFSLTVLLGVLPVLPATLLESSSSDSIVLSVLSTSLAFYAFLLLSIITYRVSPLHPLYRYPGPVLAKLSSFYGAYIAATGKQHVHFKVMHEKYGPIVRLGVPYSRDSEKSID